MTFTRLSKMILALLSSQMTEGNSFLHSGLRDVGVTFIAMQRGESGANVNLCNADLCPTDDNLF